jgi:type I restriction enzyme M protein
MSQTTFTLASDIWAVADLLRGDFKQSQYGRVILPFTLLRRLECVLEPTKAAVVEEFEKLKQSPEYALNMQLIKVAGQPFYNTSPLTLAKLGEHDTLDNLNTYIQSFSKDAREIFDNFKFGEFLATLAEADLLYRVVERYRSVDLSPERISNHDMGLVFEELIRKFAESSNETAGEHFTPRDVVRLTTALTFMEDDQALAQAGTIRTIYDPTAGTGGFLSSGMEYLAELNRKIRVNVFGQELNPESYAICKADMLIKGQRVENIKFGNTLSSDQLSGEAHHFDYMLSNPPFGVEWKKVEKSVREEHALGDAGRFGPGLPRINDGSLLFLLHLISKMRPAEEGGSRIGIILNGSPLFTGGAGSGESNIRRYILEKDLLEGIVALPTDMFYNTGIATYIWILSNHKTLERRGKVQLVDASGMFGKMRKSLGSKRNTIAPYVDAITRLYGAFEEGEHCKIFSTTAFGYRRITVERPLRLRFEITQEKLDELMAMPINLSNRVLSSRAADQAYTKRIFLHLSQALGDEDNKPFLGEAEFMAHLEKLLASNPVRGLLELPKNRVMVFLGRLYTEVSEQDLEEIYSFLSSVEAVSFPSLDATVSALQLHELFHTSPELSKKQLLALSRLFSEEDPSAQAVRAKTNKSATVTYEPYPDLRDYENVPLDEDIYTYFDREVLPHVPDAWIDQTKRDDKDREVGVVGYEIPFNRHFYTYTPPRSLEEIDHDLDALNAEIMQLLQEVHS